MPLHDDRKLFELLCFEGAQVVLFCETILDRREEYRKCFLLLLENLDNKNRGRVTGKNSAF
ncbi:MAG: DNA-3-methyladenine glycosylase I [candidate division SR1 bacterium]|nr:DNA-3-methyladenine glycosylase I [candidate division SR1 bacterium]